MTDWLAFVHIWRLIGFTYWAQNTYLPQEAVESMRRRIHALTIGDIEAIIRAEERKQGANRDDGNQRTSIE